MDTIEIKLSMAFNIQAFGTRTLDQDVGQTRSSLHKLFSNKKCVLKELKFNISNALKNDIGRCTSLTELVMEQNKKNDIFNPKQKSSLQMLLLVKGI